MSSPIAALVEDDPEQVPETTDSLTTAGFEVIHYWDASEAKRGLSDLQGQIDFLVLDRNLPNAIGDQPSNQIGDDLLEDLLAEYPDVPVAVLTGYSDEDYAQFATRHRGSITLRSGSISVDRVAPFRKSQTLEFERYAVRLHDQLMRLRDINVLPDSLRSDLNDAKKLLLRRVAFEFAGTSVRAEPLEGGVSDADVWHCAIDGPDGLVADYVVKKVKKIPSTGGFQSLLPGSLAAAVVHTVNGLCRGQCATVIQTAGRNAQPLSSLIADHSSTQDVIERLLSGLDSMAHNNTTVDKNLSDVTSYFAEWNLIEEILSTHGIRAPRPTISVRTTLKHQHGDLHPGNILVVGSDPVIIDFDSQLYGSRIIDAVSLLLGGLFHKASRLRVGSWPEPANFSVFDRTIFLQDCPFPEYFSACLDWLVASVTSERELWAVLLSFAVRQLNFPDVMESDRLQACAVELARTMAENLRAS